MRFCLGWHEAGVGRIKLTHLTAGKSSVPKRSSTQDNLSSTQPVEEQAQSQHLTQTSPQISTVLNQSPALNPSSPPGHRVPESQPISIVPALASQSVVLSSPVLSAQPSLRVPAPLAINTQVNATSTAQLTDEQIEFVKSLWSAKVPATEIARVMEWMRDGRDTSSQGLVDTDVKADVKPGTPSSYNSIHS